MKSKESIGFLPVACTVFLFVMGGTILNTGGKAQQDMWLSVLLALIPSALLCLFLGYLSKKFPGQGLFDIAYHTAPRPAALLFTLLLTWYALHTGAVVLREFAEFVRITSMHNTPLLAVLVLIMLVVLYLAKAGAGVLGKLSLLLAPLVILVFAFSFLFSLNRMDYRNLQPVLNHSPGDILHSAWGFWSDPVGEILLLFCLGRHFSGKAKIGWAVFAGIGAACACILANLLRSILILGLPYLTDTLFSQFVATRILQVGEILARIEGLTSITLCLVVIVKTCVCLLAASEGIAKIAGKGSSRLYLPPAALLLTALSYVLYTAIPQALGFWKAYPYYALPFQVLLPCLLFLFVLRKRAC